MRCFFSKPLFILICVLFIALPLRVFASGSTEKKEGMTGTVQQSGIPDSEFPLTVQDDLGNSLTIQKKPIRIVSGTLMTDEILMAMVEPSRFAAITQFAEDKAVSNVADRAREIRMRSPLNVELYVSLAPDLIFLADWSDAAAVKQLKSAGIAVYQVATPSSFPETASLIQRLALCVGEEEKGKEIVAWMNGTLDEVRKKVSRIPADSKQIVMDYSTWGTSMGKNSTWDDIVEQAGLINAVAGRTANQWGAVPVSKELLLEIDPDILVLPGWVYGDPNGADTFYDSVARDPALKGLSAVRNKRIIRISEAHRSSTSQYMALAVRDLAAAAYPELFR